MTYKFEDTEDCGIPFKIKDGWPYYFWLNINDEYWWLHYYECRTAVKHHDLGDMKLKNPEVEFLDFNQIVIKEE